MRGAVSIRLDTCPHCGVGLEGELIPAEAQALYSATNYRREIMCEVRGVYDGGLYWLCPDCGGTWHRWGDERPDLREKAERYIHAPGVGTCTCPDKRGSIAHWPGCALAEPMGGPL
jgi:hypothetical protein